jgi:hypothetical protein
MWPKVALAAVISGAYCIASGKDLLLSDMQSLTLEQLAEHALGETGRLMIDVDRPRTFGDHLRFYSRAFAPGSQYGICASEWVTLNIGKNAEITTISSTRRYGVEDSIYKKSKDWDFKQYNSLCTAVRNTRSYFPAPDPQSALTIVAYINALGGRGPSPQANYSFECSGACTGREDKAFVKSIKLENIVAASEIECDHTSAFDKCFKLTLNGQPLADYPREVRIYGKMMNVAKVEITRVKLWIGTSVY